VPNCVKPKIYDVNLKNGVNFQVTLKANCAERNQVKRDRPVMDLAVLPGYIKKRNSKTSDKKLRLVLLLVFEEDL
jgi:hypothetical protein